MLTHDAKRCITWNSNSNDKNVSKSCV